MKSPRPARAAAALLALLIAAAGDARAAACAARDGELPLRSLAPEACPCKLRWSLAAMGLPAGHAYDSLAPEAGGSWLLRSSIRPSAAAKAFGAADLDRELKWNPASAAAEYRETRPGDPQASFSYLCLGNSCSSAQFGQAAAPAEPFNSLRFSYGPFIRPAGSPPALVSWIGPQGPVPARIARSGPDAYGNISQVRQAGASMPEARSVHFPGGLPFEAQSKAAGRSAKAFLDHATDACGNKYFPEAKASDERFRQPAEESLKSAP